MNVEIYINNERADYGEKINIQYLIDDIKNIYSGRNNKSYKIALPRTVTNREIFQHIDSVTIFDELEAVGYISVDGVIILQGPAVLQGVTNRAFNVVISADDWIDSIEGLSLKDLDLSALDHDYTETNIVNSWPATGTYYYPLINFGILSAPGSSTVGAVDADMSIMDFYPAFRLEEILLKILEPWTVNSDLTGAGNLFRDYYLLCSPAVADDDFLQDKDFEAYVDSNLDNYDSAVISPTDTASATVTKDSYGNPADIDGEIEDVGANYSADKYTVPETGAYRFMAELTTAYQWTGTGSPNSQSLTYRIMRRRAAADTTLATFTTSTLAVWEVKQTLDTGRVHCEANDEIWISIDLTMEYTNNDGGDRTLEVFLELDSLGPTVSRFYSVMDEWCLFPGEGIEVDAEAWLADIQQVDFLRAIKQAFNLRFAVDRNAGTIRMEKHDDFYTANERDWTGYIDHSDVDQKMISPAYLATQRFRFREDGSDYALIAYIEDNAARPSDYDFVLSSVWAKDGVEERVSVFADTAEGKMRPIGWYTTDIIRIWDEGEEGLPFPQKRIRAWEPRLLYADGPTARPANFYFEGTNRANYPKATMTTWEDLFNDYHFNAWHMIDAGKTVTVQATIPVSEIQRFAMIVGTEAAEGFRARYKIKIGDDTFMATVNRIVYNGKMAKVEFLILK